MAEEKEVLPEDVFFLEHVGMTRSQLEETETKPCKTCRRTDKYGDNWLCLLCPYPSFFCDTHQVDAIELADDEEEVHELIGEDPSIFGLCKPHREAFYALVKCVRAKCGPFPAREEDHPTVWKQRRADLDWQDELRREILCFRIKNYGRPAPSAAEADKSEGKAKRKRVTLGQ